MTILVLEHLPYGNWKVVETSHDYKKLDAQTIEFTVGIPLNGEAKLTYTIDTWWE